VSFERLTLCALVAAVCALPAYAQSPTPQDSTAKPAANTKPPHRDRDVITRDELSASDMQALSVLDAIRKLRPNFLNVRGTQSCLSSGGCSAEDQESGKVHASVDGNRVMPLSEIATMHVSNVIEIRFLSPGAAMQKFGGDAHQGPVILIKTM
jgi:hypothetical protein